MKSSHRKIMYKKICFIVTLIILQACTVNNKAIAADDEFEIHKLVVQLNKGDEHLQSEVITNIVNISKYFGVDNVEIELVAYGKGIYFLTKESPFKARIESLMMQDVVFTACEDTINTLKRTKGIELDFIDGVQTVPNGIPRIMQLQEQGYSYFSP